MKAGRPKGISCPGLIRKAVEKAGSASRLAWMIGMTRQAVSTWTRRTSGLCPANYRKLVRFLGETVSPGRMF